ncbi:hypothetical protein RRG08_063793 [Elysia crispata]|uniref:Uncharacterized protein n=1 Tax=Elysia crispata TaxID=231223 RepID=A0AAE1AK27_9GAST|nr:hypothetical protein RRG08_063793 [Elysia crispata]
MMFYEQNVCLSNVKYLCSPTCSRDKESRDFCGVWSGSASRCQTPACSWSQLGVGSGRITDRRQPGPMITLQPAQPSFPSNKTRTFRRLMIPYGFADHKLQASGGAHAPSLGLIKGWSDSHDQDKCTARNTGTIALLSSRGREAMLWICSSFLT